jgi:hypothetical protein
MAAGLFLCVVLVRCELCGCGAEEGVKGGGEDEDGEEAGLDDGAGNGVFVGGGEDVA